jgi:hypothetical protein
MRTPSNERVGRISFFQSCCEHQGLAPSAPFGLCCHLLHRNPPRGFWNSLACVSQRQPTHPSSPTRLGGLIGCWIYYCEHPAVASAARWSRQYGLEKSKGLGSDDCNRRTGVVAGAGPCVVACICRALMERHCCGCEHSLDSLCNHSDVLCWRGYFTALVGLHRRSMGSLKFLSGLRSVGRDWHLALRTVMRP